MPAVIFASRIDVLLQRLERLIFIGIVAELISAVGLMKAMLYFALTQ